MRQNQTHILLGAGGHAKVVLALVRALGYRLDGVCAPELVTQKGSTWLGCPVFGDDQILDRFTPGEVALVNGVGQLPGRRSRAELRQIYETKGFFFPSLVHPTAWLTECVSLAEGVQVMAGVSIQPGVRIGAGTIVNTGATVDHDCVIGPDVHIAPGATICGDVEIGAGVFIGAGATLINGSRIGANTVVAAGAVVRGVVPPDTRTLGLYAKGERKRT